MKDTFQQKNVQFSSIKSTGMITVGKLMTIIEKNPYYTEIINHFNIQDHLSESIVVGNVDIAFNEIANKNKEYSKFAIMAGSKDIAVNDFWCDGVLGVKVHFEEFIEVDELKENLEAESIYDSRNTLFDEYKMSKYANFLLEAKHSTLLRDNINFFRQSAKDDDKKNKIKSYRLLEKDGKHYLRGITSEKYNEYGIDFAFFLGIFLLHINMKKNDGNNYKIVHLSVSESKLDFILKNNKEYQVENFGTLSFGCKISTNELGTGSLNITSTIRLMDEHDETRVYLFPKSKFDFTTKQIITHTTSLENVLVKFKELEKYFDLPNQFIIDLQEARQIKNSDELRHKIQLKIEHPNSVFKNIKELSDIFKKKIENEITNFSKLLDMCALAEKVELDSDLKDKLRYIISDIILYGNTKE